MSKDDSLESLALVAYGVVVGLILSLTFGRNPPPGTPAELCARKTHEADGRSVSCALNAGQDVCSCTYLGEPIK